jgi:hypothetical protein
MPVVPTCYYAIDWSEKTDWIYKAVRHFDITRFFDSHYSFDGYIPVRRTKEVYPEFCNPAGVRYASYSPVLMTEMALWMGAGKVVLLGMDKRLGKYKYFWSKHPVDDVTRYKYEQNCLKRQAMQFERFKSIKHKIKVANCESRLEWFEHITL